MAATIKDVALRANTSTATVSKVMNGSYSISQATIDRVNQAMQELAALHPTFERDGNTFWVTYTVVSQVPETLAEAHEMRGDAAYCGECPHCIRERNRFGEVDMRKKWATCGDTGERIRIDDLACDAYYKLAERR